MARSSVSSSQIDTLMVDVRASTQGFAQDVNAMRSTFDGTLVGGFDNAGKVLEASLLKATKAGGKGFTDLGALALKVLEDIAAAAIKSLFHLEGGSKGGGGLLGEILGSIPSILGLPGRATGGPVSPGQAYMVGERGPELFVPTSAGAINANQPSGQDVRITINVNAGSNGEGAQALQRSSRQIASAVRRALSGV